MKTTTHIYIKYLLLLLVVGILPFASFAQSKKKKLRLQQLQQQQENATLLTNLKTHIEYLSSKKIEGIRTETQSEANVIQYLISQYQQLGLEPKGDSNKYVRTFAINKGKQILEDSNTMLVNNKRLELTKDFFPLSFSISKEVSGSAALVLNESKEPWFKDVKDWLEDNQENPLFNIHSAILQTAEKAYKKGATALCLYNSGKLPDHLFFDANDSANTTKIPVVYITKDGLAKHFKDYAATQTIAIKVRITNKIRIANNITAFINNHATNTVVIAAHYNCLGVAQNNHVAVADSINSDNAGGTATLIELARFLKTNTTPTQNNYLFVHFNSEEIGYNGVKYWETLPNVSTSYILDLDVLNQYDTLRKLSINTYHTTAFLNTALTTANAQPLQIVVDSVETAQISKQRNYANFYNTSIPVLSFFTAVNHKKVTNTNDKINYDTHREIVQYVYRFIQAAINANNKLTSTK